MSINQITITTMAIILTAFTSGAVAGPANKDNPGKSVHEQQKDKPGMTGHEHQAVDSHKQGWGTGNPDVEIVVMENQGWRLDNKQGNENSNRQSDPDSTRGLERAAERRSDNANKHGQPDEEYRWYDFIFGEKIVKADKDKNRELAERKPRWWWPFN